MARDELVRDEEERVTAYILQEKLRVDYKKRTNAALLVTATAANGLKSRTEARRA